LDVEVRRVRQAFLKEFAPCEGVRRLLACAFARSVLHLYTEGSQPDGPAVIATVLATAERFAFGLVDRAALRRASYTVDALAYAIYPSFHGDPGPAAGVASTYVAETAASAAYDPCNAGHTVDAATFAIDAAIYAGGDRPAVRLNQARILTLFQSHAWSERARAIGQRWVETYWEYGDDRLTRLVLSDLLEEEGWDGQGYLVRALREFPVGHWYIGMGPMVPDQN
jgi:hypothetical protein